MAKDNNNLSPQAVCGVFSAKLVPGTAGTAAVRNLCGRWRAGGWQMLPCPWLGLCIPCPHRWSFGAPWQPLPPHTPSHLLALTDPAPEWLSSGESRTKRCSSTSGCETRQAVCSAQQGASNEGSLQSRSFLSRIHSANSPGCSRDGIARDFFFYERVFLSWEKLGDVELDLVLLLPAQLYTENKKGQRRTNWLWKSPPTNLASILPALPIAMSLSPARGSWSPIPEAAAEPYQSSFRGVFSRLHLSCIPGGPLPPAWDHTFTPFPISHPFPHSRKEQQCCLITAWSAQVGMASALHPKLEINPA